NTTLTESQRQSRLAVGHAEGGGPHKGSEIGQKLRAAAWRTGRAVRRNWSMNQPTDCDSRQTIGRAFRGAAAVLFFAAASIHPTVADAAHDGRGFHGNGGGVYGGGGPPWFLGFRGRVRGVLHPYLCGVRRSLYRYGLYR